MQFSRNWYEFGVELVSDFETSKGCFPWSIFGTRDLSHRQLKITWCDGFVMNFLDVKLLIVTKTLGHFFFFVQWSVNNYWKMKMIESLICFCNFSTWPVYSSGIPSLTAPGRSLRRRDTTQENNLWTSCRDDYTEFLFLNLN